MANAAGVAVTTVVSAGGASLTGFKGAVGCSGCKTAAEKEQVRLHRLLVSRAIYAFVQLTGVCFQRGLRFLLDLRSAGTRSAVTRSWALCLHAPEVI